MNLVDHPHREKIANWLVIATVLSCSAQLAWFARRCIHQIDFDGMAYTGIARHLHEGEFHAAINAFRSPLISWLIAAASFIKPDYLGIGKLVSVGSFVLCLALLYAFAAKLWGSRVVAALAALLFTLGRGLAVVALGMVTPDFLFADLVLMYFIVLLRCIRSNQFGNWYFLGVVHGLAFLAKSFAFPWLTVCTGVATVAMGAPRKTAAARFGAAILVPLIIAAGWAGVLHSKYGVYTTGTQFKANLLQWTLHAYPEHRAKTYSLLRDTSQELDDYVVHDPMPPGSWAWTYPTSFKRTLPGLARAEEHNIPLALKELTIVATPGALLAFVAAAAIFTRERRDYPVEWRMMMVIAAALASLLGAYCMLVFDERYLFPVIPLVLAVAARFLVPDPKLNHRGWRVISTVLVVLGIVASLVYPSSPFRVLTQDFQAGSYNAGAMLRKHPGDLKLVSLGTGPFPRFGVGWEAGYQAAYFSGARLIATTDTLPDPTEIESLIADLDKATPDAVVIWGTPSDRAYVALVSGLALYYPHETPSKIADPFLGEVGSVVFTGR
jgi:hypothetical protein